MATKAGSGGSREKGRRAGANAPPTPCKRLGWPSALKLRLHKAGIETKPKRCR
jgi:hypothetical protein